MITKKEIQEVVRSYYIMLNNDAYNDKKSIIAYRNSLVKFTKYLIETIQTVDESLKKSKKFKKT